MKCKNEKLLAKIGKKKLTKETEVDFTVLNPLDDCRRINTRDYYTATGGVTYNRYQTPADAFNCYGDKCANSGTLSIPGDGKAVYRVPLNALDTYLGIIAFYAIPNGKITVRISNDVAFTNADVYEPTYLETVGFTPVVVDLSKAPKSTEGTGWTYRSGENVFIEIGSVAELKISTIMLFESIEAFDTMNVVKISCVSAIDGAWANDLAEETCVEEGDYDTENPNYEFTITGKLMTGNYNILNPMDGKGEKSRGWQIASISKTTRTVEGKYGGKSFITLDDMDLNECGFLSVQIEDYCHTTDAQMIRLNLPVADDIALDDRHYIVIKNGDGTADLVFGLEADMKMLISYPQIADIEHYVGNLDNMVGKTVRMSFAEYMSDGTKYVNVLNNMKVTSFPWSSANEEGEFEITLAVRRDANDNFYERMRILSAATSVYQPPM